VNDRSVTSRPRGRPSTERQAAPGWDSLLLTALSIGIVLLAVQLWLLTVALDIYLGGERGGLWALALISGLVFLGGLAAWRIISRRRPSPPAR
jgi:hypothetical protein